MVLQLKSDFLLYETVHQANRTEKALTPKKNNIPGQNFVNFTRQKPKYTFGISLGVNYPPINIFLGGIRFTNTLGKKKKVGEKM